MSRFSSPPDWVEGDLNAHWCEGSCLTVRDQNWPLGEGILNELKWLRDSLGSVEASGTDLFMIFITIGSSYEKFENLKIC